MGSYEKGIFSGFLCRLCSKMAQYVFLIYGRDGKAMNLSNKINTLLPVTVTPNDNLPKAVCVECVRILEGHHSLVEMVKANSPKLFPHQRHPSTSSAASSSA